MHFLSYLFVKFFFFIIFFFFRLEYHTMKILSVKQENCILSSSKYINLYNQLVIGHYVTPPLSLLILKVTLSIYTINCSLDIGHPPLSFWWVRCTPKILSLNLHNQRDIGQTPPPLLILMGVDAPFILTIFIINWSLDNPPPSEGVRCTPII